jgi:hypothetical protein
MHAIAQDYGISPPNLRYEASDINVYDHRTTTVDATTGSLPGRAYKPAGQKPEVTDPTWGDGRNDQTCVSVLYKSGGSIGYRPMLGVETIPAAVDAWRHRIADDSRIADAVADLAGEIYETFFERGLNGSSFSQAPPIWQQLDFLACVDGRIRPVIANEPRSPIFRQSHMPDNYLYLDGVSMRWDGTVSTPSAPFIGPVQKGNFQKFTNHPTSDALLDDAYGECDTETGSSGNPWGMPVYLPPNPGVTFSDVHFCVNSSIPIDPEHD